MSCSPQLCPCDILQTQETVQGWSERGCALKCNSFLLLETEFTRENTSLNNGLNSCGFLGAAVIHCSAQSGKGHYAKPVHKSAVVVTQLRVLGQFCVFTKEGNVEESPNLHHEDF